MVSLTVFVVSDGESAASVRDLAAAWTRAGILTPSLWVTPTDVDEAHGGPPSVRALHVHTTGAELVDLFEHIGRFRLDVVRVVSAHLAVGAEEELAADLAVKVAGSAVAGAIDAALPRRSDSGSGGSRLHRAVVVIPASGAGGVSPEVFEPSWEVNAVVSPEDRPDLDRSNIFVRRPGNFDGHAAAALAAIGGAVRGVGHGALDDITTDSTSRAADAVVARVSMRAIIGEDLVDRIAARALDPRELTPDGPAQVLPWARPATRPDLVAQSAASYLLARPEWADAPPPRLDDPSSGHQRFWKAVWTAVKYNVRTVGAVLAWLLSRGRARVEARATDALVGAGAGVLVTLGPRPVDDLTGASARLLERERSRIDREMQLQATRTLPPPPSTWTELRRLVFALVDGGDLGDFPEPRQAGKRELLPARSVVVEPDRHWTRLDGPAVPATDPRAMRQYQSWLDEQRRDAHEARARCLAAVDALRQDASGSPAPPSGRRSKRNRKRESAADASAPEATSEAPEAVEEEPEPQPASDERLRAAEAELEAVEESLRELTAEHEGFRVWFDSVATSLVWRLSDDVGRRSSQMRRLQRDIQEAKDKEPPPAHALRRAHTLLIGTWRSALLVTFIVVGVLVYLRYGWLNTWTDLRLSSEGMWWGIGLVLLVVAVVLASANHHFYKAVQRYEWDVEQRLARIHRDKAMFLHAGQERARLDLLYDMLRDWTDILGELLHRPWAARQRHYEDLPDEVVEALPAAMGVASQMAGADDIPAKVMLEAWWAVYPQGWASRHFELAYSHWEEHDVQQPDEGHRSVDVDALDSPASPRRRLREFVQTGAARELLAEKAYEDLMAAVQEGDIVLPERMVQRVGRYGDGEYVSEREFHRASATESTLFATDIFSDVAKQGRKHYVERSAVWLPVSGRVGMEMNDGVVVRECAGPTALRVDVSRRVPAGELVTFTSSSTDGAAGPDVAHERATPHESESAGFY